MPANSLQPDRSFAIPCATRRPSSARVMTAMAAPGTIRDAASRRLAPPPPLRPAAAALALTLCDFETPVWLDAAAVARAPGVAEFLRFHTGARLVARRRPTPAFAFVAVARGCPPLVRLRAGHARLSRPLDDARDRAGRYACPTSAAGGSRARASRLVRVWRRRRCRPIFAARARAQPRASSLRRRHRSLPRHDGSPPCRARRAWRLRRPACTSRSRVARRQSTTRTRCSPASGAATRRCPRLPAEQIREQLTLAVDRVMGEGSLYDPRPRRARHQAGARRSDRGDLPASAPIARRCRASAIPSRSTPTRWRIRRRISATYKDLPGGQVLGPTFDYTHRLLDFGAGAAQRAAEAAPRAPVQRLSRCRT